MAESALEARVELALRGLYLPPHVREYAFAPPRRWRWDFCWPSHKVAMEIDGGIYRGGAHSRGPGIEKDHEKRNTGVLLGWRILVFGPRAVESGNWIAVVETVLGVTRHLDLLPPRR